MSRSASASTLELAHLLAESYVLPGWRQPWSFVGSRGRREWAWLAGADHMPARQSVCLLQGRRVGTPCKACVGFVSGAQPADKTRKVEGVTPPLAEDVTVVGSLVQLLVAFLLASPCASIFACVCRSRDVGQASPPFRAIILPCAARSSVPALCMPPGRSRFPTACLAASLPAGVALFLVLSGLVPLTFAMMVRMNVCSLAGLFR